ncbi:cytochrome P450 2B19-like [Paramacrobiotus metropolitanus]|uniref:cytochrome P450 2B19-like n=1 Tax=Paramacrobiotus metropolitanus TaxID=2943436 RepID=UPI002445C448|nr:cytochrome P450 2B19-like [Paramacrobiotus metropolitanus]
MILILQTVLSFFLFGIGYFFYHDYKRRRLHFPPGPIGLPVIGSLASFGNNPHVTFDKWRRKYGSDTVGCRLGSQNIVILHDLVTIRKTLADEDSTGRTHITFGTKDLESQDGVHYGVVNSEGELWQEHRRFTLSTLKDFGMGKTWLEDAIIEEIDDLCCVLESYGSRAMDPAKHIYHCAANIICALLFGKRFDHDDEGFTRLATTVADQVEQASDDFLFLVCPYLQYIPGRFRNRCRKAQENYRNIAKFTENFVKRHRQTVAQHEARDYIDAYLLKAGSLDNERKEFYSDKQLEVAMYDLFITGTETTSTTIVWCLLFMLEYPNIKKKVQEEIDLFTDEKKREVRFGDKGVLPLTEATILEVQRMTTIAALAVPHRAKRDMLIDGYFVPEDTWILPNLYSVHHDPKHWESPEEFNPYRFLDKDGVIDKAHTFVVFGIGRRACPGELLARMELFLMFARLMQRFDITLLPGNTVSHTDYCTSIVLSPKPFENAFIPRQR